VRVLSAEALVLDVVDLHEVDRIVTFLTREHGKKRGVARGARRKHARFAGQLQPLAKVQVTWFERPGRELVRVEQVELVRAAGHLLADLEGILLGSYLAEHVGAFAQEDAQHEPLYRLLDAALAALAERVDPDLVARYVEVWVLRLEGLFPTPRVCPVCGAELAAEAWLTADGALVCAACRRDRPGSTQVAAAALELLRRSGRESLAQLAAAPPSRAALREVERVCGRIRRGFLGHELRSYEVMRRTLAELPLDDAAAPAAGARVEAGSGDGE
jgi:DNA repair protein RecO (recombination protein O)